MPRFYFHSPRIALLLALLLLAIAPGADADPARLAQRLAESGLENVRVEADSAGCRIRAENRRFRSANFALGVIASAAARECPGPCEVVLESRGLALSRVSFRTGDFESYQAGRLPARDFMDSLRVELLPDAPTPTGRALSPSRLRMDVAPRILLDGQFGHLREPVSYHLEIAPELTTQPWKGALLRLGWAFPVAHGNDIAPSLLRPDSDRSRPSEAAVYQFVRLPSRGLGSLSAGYFGENRYGLAAGAGFAVGGRLYLDGFADATGSLTFRPEVVYSGVSRVTFAAGLSVRPAAPDLVITVRGGRYLFGRAGTGAGEYAIRGEVIRRFHQVEMGAFVTKSESNRYGGIRLSLPIPPMVRLRPSAIRPDLHARFPFEYRTEEGQFEATASDPRLRSNLLDDLWPSAVGAQLDDWLSGARWARGAAGGDGNP